MRKLLLSLFALLLVSSAEIYAQDSIVLEPARDNTLYESASGNISNGSGVSFFVGNTNNGDIRRALLFFDLTTSELPDGATIDSVFLELTVTKSTRAGSNEVTVHEVLKDWGEAGSNALGGGGGGTSAQAGDATWTANFFGTSNWDIEGGDFDDTELVSTTIGGPNTYPFPSSADLTALVQRWVDSPETNFGLLIKSVESGTTAKRYASREGSSSPNLTIFFTAVGVSNEEETDIPTTAVLEQNYPNPFNPSTNITFALPEASQVQLNVYDIVGRRVATVFDGFRAAGSHTFNFDASQLSSGIYIYTLEGSSFLLSRKFTLLK